MKSLHAQPFRPHPHGAAQPERGGQTNYRFDHMAKPSKQEKSLKQSKAPPPPPFPQPKTPKKKKKTKKKPQSIINLFSVCLELLHEIMKVFADGALKVLGNHLMLAGHVKDFLEHVQECLRPREAGGQRLSWLHQAWGYIEAWVDRETAHREECMKNKGWVEVKNCVREIQGQSEGGGNKERKRELSV